MTQETTKPINFVFFDFGGVIAEEGFLNVFMSVAAAQGLDPRQVLQEAVNAAYDDGYLTGKIDEAAFWQSVRDRSGLQGEDNAMRKVMFDGFRIRPRMLAFVELLRKNRPQGLHPQRPDQLAGRTQRDTSLFRQVRHGHQLLARRAEQAGPGLF